MQPQFMQLAIQLALGGIKKGHGPFGAVVVKDNEVVGTGTNMVTTTNDPSAHAEICAIRNACARVKDFSLAGHQMYTSCEPCPMCLGAIYWSRIDCIYFGATRDDAARAQFDDSLFYEEIGKTAADRSIPLVAMMREEALQLFNEWEKFGNKIRY